MSESLPFEPESSERLRARFPLVLDRSFDPDDITAGRVADPSRDRRHVFDFRDDVEEFRAVASIARRGGNSRLVITVTAQGCSCPPCTRKRLELVVGQAVIAATPSQILSCRGRSTTSFVYDVDHFLSAMQLVAACPITRLPREPQTIEQMRSRFDDALVGEYSLQQIKDGKQGFPGGDRRHVFDWGHGAEAWRLIVSIEHERGFPPPHRRLHVSMSSAGAPSEALLISRFFQISRINVEQLKFREWMSADGRSVQLFLDADEFEAARKAVCA